MHVIRVCFFNIFLTSDYVSGNEMFLKTPRHTVACDGGVNPLALFQHSLYERLTSARRV